MNDVITAHKFCVNNKKELQNDKKCGCFYCLKIFEPTEITRWLNEGNGTALCPYCGTDSVIGESSGFPVENGFLKKMNEYWFNQEK